MQKKLIVNADDLGLSEETNRGILAAHHNGIVTSATLMVTMDAVEHAITNIAGTSLDVGLHIDLSWGRPVSQPTEISSLVDVDGRFIGKKPLLKQLLLGRSQPLEIEREIFAQIQRFKDTGLPLVHMDVHQHFHGFPVVMKTLVKAARAERVPCIRFVNERAWTPPVNLIINLMFRLSRRHFPRQMRVADHFLGLALTDRLNTESLVLQLENVQPGLTELMCHPGYHDPSLHGLSRLQSREAEIAALTSKQVKTAITSHGIFLTTFRDELQRADN